VTGLIATDARHFEGTMTASDDGSDPATNSHPKDLLRIVWEGIEGGRLFVLPDSQSWAGPPTGQLCIVCERKIQAANEHEIVRPDGPVFAHVKCYAAWYHESEIRRNRPDSTAAASP
jgi:hypothetical protein